MDNPIKKILRAIVTGWRKARRKRAMHIPAARKVYFADIAKKKRAEKWRAFIKRIPPRTRLITCVILAIIVVTTVTLSLALATPSTGTQQDALAPAASGAAATPDPAAPPAPTPTPPLDPMTTDIKEGTTAPVVADIQQRLMDLNYMDDDEPTQLYGPMTKNAVELFQRQAGLSVDGMMGAETYTKLMADDAQKYLVSKGADGTDVHEMQIRLRELGYMKTATNHFGTDTEAAVKKFQQLNGLSADGAVGSETLEMMYSEDAKANFFAKGEYSEDIKSYQVKLQKLGYLTSTPDGKYGDDTIIAVKRFQDRNGVIADGYMGPQTISLLKSAKAQGNALMLGMKGDDVQNVQQRLKELNYIKSTTGYYGSSTENAVKAFQKRNGLSPDGKVGRQTLNTLLSSKAKKAATASSSTGSNSGNTGNTGNTNTGGSDTNSGGDTPAAPDAGGVSQFIAVAKTKLGSRYVSGGKGPNVFDCSGFVYWCLNHAGVTQSYMTSAMWQKCGKYQKISNMGDLQAGDVISYKGHVAIYIGNGQQIDASSSNGHIRITTGSIFNSSYWKSHFVCGFRIF
jgi:peptidoglycan DL-endopeptidase CwlO